MSIHLGELILRFQSFFAFLLFFTDFKNRGHMMKLYFMVKERDDYDDDDVTIEQSNSDIF
ncbi:hypothetical protein Bca4012_017709 [Brassica carinata]